MDMDWTRAIEINQAALTRIVAGLIAMVGLAVEGAVARLPRPVYRAALSVLRRVESAARRLIVIAAKGVVVKLHATRPMPPGLARASSGSARRVSFQLFDPRKRFGPMRPRSADLKAEPRVFVFGASPLVPLFQPRMAVAAGPEPDGMVGAACLNRRLAAVKMALENLPHQAKRLARWQARRDRMANPKFRSPLRPGPPPGYRKEPKDDVDLVLRKCHVLARDALHENSS
jgi:hypothetical protein